MGEIIGIMQYSYRTARKLIVLAIGGTVLLHPLAMVPCTAQAAGGGTKAAQGAGKIDTAPRLAAIRESPVTDGATRKHYQARATGSDGTETVSNVHVIEIDLTNPYVSLNAMIGKGGTLPSKSSVLNMAKETGAVAGVNADYFDTQAGEQVAFGAQIAGGTLIKSPR